MSTFLQYLFSGISLGVVYSLTAIGYSLVYGVLEMINFTHGYMYMLGAMLFWAFATLFEWPWILAFIISLSITGLMGYIVERFTLRPLRHKNMPNFAALICTFGIGIILQNSVLLMLGSSTKQFPTLFAGKYFIVLGASISAMQIFTVAISAILMFLLSQFISKTKTGMAMRSTAQNRDAAELMGIPVDRIIAMTFVVGSALAAVAGICSGMIFRNVDIAIGVTTGIKTFAATVLGGIGELKGAVIGGILIGIVEAYTAGYISPNVKDIAAFALLIIVLIVRPNGLFGKPVQKKV